MATGLQNARGYVLRGMHRPLGAPSGLRDCCRGGRRSRHHESKKRHPRPQRRGANMVLHHTPSLDIRMGAAAGPHPQQLLGKLHRAEGRRTSLRHKADLGESLRSFFKKFAEVKCQVKGVNETTIINAAICGLQTGPLSEKTGPETYSLSGKALRQDGRVCPT